ncbi:MAG TPA: LysR family transcriptional regulator [Acidimicrobiales bacterium]|nr:LysR family transcriptional regulator [Acidimicrobiales bacterium]
MNLRQLRALLAVAENEGFSAAASELHTVQSNVSSHIANLEAELGAILVDRPSGRLTVEGAVVAARVRCMETEIEAMHCDLASFHRGFAGTARVGMIATTARWLAPLFFAELTTRHPAVHLVVVEGTSTSLEELLLSSRLDLAIVDLADRDSALILEPLFDEDLLLVVPPDHALANEQEIDFTDLNGIELILPPRHTAFRTDIDRAAMACGVTIRTKAEFDGVRLIASITFDGHGAAILPATAVPTWLRDRCSTLVVHGLPRRHIGKAQRRRGRPPALMVAVNDLLSHLATREATPERGIHLPATELAVATCSITSSIDEKQAVSVQTQASSPNPKKVEIRV